MNSVTVALTAVMNLRAQSIQLRRGNTTVNAQPMRLERLSKSQQWHSEASRERRADGTLLGASNLDIAVDDRFNADGLLWRVSFIQPNRQYMTIAEVQVIQ